LIKSESKGIYDVAKDFCFKQMLFLNFLFIKESWKMLSNTTIFVIHNRKCF